MYKRGDGGSGGCLPTTSHLHMFRDGGVLTAAFYHRRRPIDYTNLHDGTHSPRKVLHTFKKILIFSKLFWALFPASGAFAFHIRIPLLSLRIPIFFPNFDLF